MGRKTLVDRRIKTFPTPLMPIVYNYVDSLYIFIMYSFYIRKERKGRELSTLGKEGKGDLINRLDNYI